MQNAYFIEYVAQWTDVWGIGRFQKYLKTKKKLQKLEEKCYYQLLVLVFCVSMQM